MCAETFAVISRAFHATAWCLAQPLAPAEAGAHWVAQAAAIKGKRKNGRAQQSQSKEGDHFLAPE